MKKSKAKQDAHPKQDKKTYRIKNWPHYNEALKRRGSITLYFSEEAIKAWYYRGPKQRGAQYTYTDLAIETTLILKAVFSLALRQSEGFVTSLIELMQLRDEDGEVLRAPNYSTLSRRQGTLKIDLAPSRSREALHLVADSTGLKVYGEGEWKVRQHGWSKRRTWRKLHLGLDEKTGEIHACVLTTNSIDDAEMVGSLLDEVEEEVDRFGADGAYDKRKAYEELIDREIDPVIPPRRDAVIWQHGNCKGPRHPRDEALRYIRRHGRKKWKRESGYHRRSKAETAMYRYKQTFGGELGSRTLANQKVEGRLKAKVLNKMAQVGMPESYAVA